MFKITMLIIGVMLLTFSVAAFAEFPEPYRDPNAALRYLMAIGYMPEMAKEEVESLMEVHNAERYAALSGGLRRKLGEAGSFRIKSLLQSAAACSVCSFVPDSKFDPQDIMPPYRTLRNFARFINAGAWGVISAGNHEQGAEMLVSVFRFGADSEKYQPLIGYMLGLGIRNIAMESMKNFLAGDYRAEAKKIITDYLKSLPKPAFNAKNSLVWERAYLVKTLDMLTRSTEGVVELLKVFGDESASAPASNKPMACVPNQRVLMGAIEMALMDGLKFENGKKGSEIIAELVEKKYLKAGLACPDKGEYKIEFIKEDDYKVSCSCGADPEKPVEKKEEVKPALNPELEVKAKEYLASGRLEKDVRELYEYFDKVMACDPLESGLVEKLQTMKNDYESRDNMLIKAIVPDFSKVYEKQFKLQETIDGLIR